MINILYSKESKIIMIKKRKDRYFTPHQIIVLHSKKHKTYRETKSLTQRLYKQTIRKPSTLFISIIQPLLWLVMFGALFQNAPIYLFREYKLEYREFLNAGIIIFTAFNSSINAGITIVFDREFGFLNRILISPISNKNSLIYSCVIHTWLITISQIMGIILITCYQNQKNANYLNNISNLNNIIIAAIIITMIIISVSNLSICNALVLPGHIEFIGLTTFFLNLPTLFTSTALAPLSFMPNWLQVIACINPLTYAIEIIRNLHLNKYFQLGETIVNIDSLQLSGIQGITILLFTNIFSFILVKNIIKYKYDKT
uniref:ABC transmembrane type-2 domain-containing protein n=1 Tax=Vertebrata lanosa TaxID=1261582 RepID=A0A0B5W3D2_9FLOR|nr:hypothetical protein [Vertebrata lanosa]AJH65900.1 hypothetical protein [Vertebrata lanosa]